MHIPAINKKEWVGGKPSVRGISWVCLKCGYALLHRERRGGVAQWLGRQSSAGGLSLIYT